jgi:methylmalonyl-CoA decarboxylase
VKSHPLIQIDLAEGVGQLTLTHTRKLNVMGNALVNQLIDGLTQLVSDGALTIIVRTLPGVKVWSAGYDINELPPHGQDPLECHEPLRRAVRAMQACPVPILMQIEGSVWGGACELVMNADIIVASEGSVISFTPSRLGVPYNPSGIMSFLNSIPLHILKEMFYRAQQVPVERLAQYGVINHVVPAAELEEFTLHVALDITKTAPLANAVFKEQVTSITNSIPLTSNEFERIESSRRVVYCSEDYLEGVTAIKEKRTPVFKRK